MLRSVRVCTLVLLLLVVFAGACSEERTAHIGAVLPLTGEWAIYGESIRKGIELAHEELVAAFEAKEFPHRMELWVEDDESDPTKAAEAFEHLIAEHNIHGVIGGVTSAEALTMIDIADQRQRVMISPSASSPDITEQKATRYFYRIYPSDFNEGTKLASWTALNLDLDSIVVVAANTPFARGISRVFKNEFERYDGEVPAELVYSSQEEFPDLARQVDRSEADGVYIADFAGQVRSFIDALDRAGFEGRILTTSAFATTETLAAAGDKAEGVVLAQTVFDPESDDPLVQSFVEAFREKHGEMPDLFAAHGYDAMKVMAEASKEESGVPSEMWKGVRGLGDYQGVTGAITFDQKGDVGKFPRVYVVQGGKLVDYDAVLDQKRRELQQKKEQIFKEIERLHRRAGGQG